MAAEPKQDIPILTDAIGRRNGESHPWHEVEVPAVGESLGERSPTPDRETLIAELQTEIAASMFALTDEIMRNAFAEMEASVFAQISGELRRKLPELIDARLRERLGDNTEY
jgi:hypothetical protein